MKNRKVLVGLIFLLFLVGMAQAIIVNSQASPPSYASAYVASVSVSSNPFILNTAKLPAINQLGSNVRFFKYANLTGQLYAYEQQLPQTIAVVNTVESTGWKVYPYWKNGQLVINSTGARSTGQYIVWRYSPISNTINITIKVSSFPTYSWNPGIDILSANPPTDYDYKTGNYYWLAIEWSGTYEYSTPTSGVSRFGSSSIPNLMGKAFTETIILTKNSAGNITISQIYVNGTLYSSPNINIPFPWNQIAYIGIRGDGGNLFYVSYFDVSPAPYGGVEEFVDNAESTSWKVYPYWQNGQLIVNSTGAYGGRYIAWKYSSMSNTINITIKVSSFPTYKWCPGIDILSANPPAEGDSGNNYLLIIEWSGTYQYKTPTSGLSPIIGSSSIPNLMGKAFTETIILTKNSAGNITISQIYVNGTLYSSPNINIPFPWNQIAYIGIRGDTGNVFYVSYFGVTQLLDAYYLVSDPTTNTPYTGTVYVSVFPYPISYDVYVSLAPIVSSQSPLPIFSPSSTLTTTLYPVVSTNTNNGTVYVIPSIGAWNSANVSLFLTTLAVSDEIYVNIPMVESTLWKTYPYWQVDQLVVNSTGASGGQYIAWRFSPMTNTTNITIRVAGYPSGIQGSSGIVIYSSNIGAQTSDSNANNFQGLLVSFSGDIIYHSTTSGYTFLKSSAFPTPSTQYPFTFTVILTKNSVGNVTVSTVYINGTAYSVNVNTPFPWTQIGYVGIRADSGNLFYILYFGVSSIPLVSFSGVTSFNFYSPFSLSYTITNTSITVQNTQLANGENYLIIPGANGIIGASFAFYNVSNNVPVLAVSSSPVSATYGKQTLTLMVISASQSFVVSPFGAPQQNYPALTGGIVMLSQSGKLTFYASYQPSFVPSSVVSPPPPTSTIVLPPPPTSINPNQVSVVINGSVYLTAPWLVHYSILSLNSSVTAYLIYNYSINRPELVLSSPTNVNVNVTFTASNGTVLLSERVVSPAIVILPIATGNVTVKTTNSTVVIPITYQRFNVVALANAIMNAPFLGAIAILTLFFISFFIALVFRTVPNSMALGSVVYITAVAPFLIAIGFPMSTVMLTVVLAVVALIYAIWALRTTNVER